MREEGKGCMFANLFLDMSASLGSEGYLHCFAWY